MIRKYDTENKWLEYFGRMENWVFLSAAKILFEFHLIITSTEKIIPGKDFFH